MSRAGVYTSPIERMLRRLFVKPNGCWMWPGASVVNPDYPNGGRYGKIGDTQAGKTLLTHRVSYEHFRGPIPEGIQVDHACHTPACTDQPCYHRLCWNPDHLRLVTSAQNTSLGNSPGATVQRSGMCRRGLHKRTERNTIRKVRASGTVSIQCRSCANAIRRAGAAKGRG